jgi:hypothetical protein
LTVEFSDDPNKQSLLKAFLRKGQINVGEKTLDQIVADLRAFLMPPAKAASSGKGFTKRWHAGQWD